MASSALALILATVIAAGNTVTVDYAPFDGPDFIRDTRDRTADSFSWREVKNDTAPDPLPASSHDVPACKWRKFLVSFRDSI